MKNIIGVRRTAALAAIGLGLSGCVSAEQTALYSATEPGFQTVKAGAATALRGQQTVWVQSEQQAQQVNKLVKAFVDRKTLNADTAVQVALYNNKGLQAAYADLGLSAAEAWQQTMLQNPVLTVGMVGIGAPELGIYRAIEGVIAANILALATQKKRVDVADVRFRQAQFTALLESLRLAAETRRSWITAVSALENVQYLEKAQVAANAAAELGRKLGETGALPKAEQAREQAFYAELTGQLAEAKLQARLAREQLTRLMGLWGKDIEYKLPQRLPALPDKLQASPGIETAALKNRVDLKIARLELDALAKSYKLTDATRYVTDLGLAAGVELEREIETEYELEDGKIEEKTSKNTLATPLIELDYAIPIFDSGKARLRKAELAYMQAANRLAEKAVNIRSEARSAYTAYRATYDIAQHYQKSVVPLRTEIEKESLLTYNGMITNTFELLADSRSKVNALLMASNAKREFWLAEANLSTTINGGGGQPGSGGGAGPTVADAGGSPH